MKKSPATKKVASGVQQTLSHFFSKSPNTAAKNDTGSSTQKAHPSQEKKDVSTAATAALKRKSSKEAEAGSRSSAKKEEIEVPDVVEMEVEVAPAADSQKKRKVECESSDEEPVRRVRNRVRKNLREPSSDEEEDVVDTMESDDLSEKRNSSHTTPAKSEKIEKKSVSKLPTTPLGKLPLNDKKEVKEDSGDAKRSKPAEVPESRLSEKEQINLHAKFVKKVSLFRERQLDQAADTGKGRARDSENGSFLVPCDLTYPRGAKLTPFEAQVVEIKKNHPDTVLLVECGYKFRFLGRDAEIAAKVLNIFHHVDHNFLTASIPVFRLQIHLRRLVEAGYKVGVVRQMETAALKAVSKDKSKAFQRELCEVYTKSTMLVEDVDVLGQHTHVTGGSGAGSNAAYMMCVCEDPSRAIEVDSPSEGTAERVLMGMVCVDTASGDIVYDEFEDGPMRSELESRVSQLQPRELVLPEGLSTASSKLLRRLFAQGSSASSARFETISSVRFQPDNAKKSIKKFFEEQMQDASDGHGEGSCDEVGCVGEGRIGGMGLDSILKLPAAALSCLAGLLSYLKEFKLDQVLRLTSNFWRFNSPSHMMLDATVLSNLEVLCNQNDGTEHGSLIWLLKNTKTSFGGRLLRHWVTHPLLDKERIVARHDAVEELMAEPAAVEPLTNHLKGLPDLERALARVHYGKCAPNELVAVLKAFQKVSVLGRQSKACVDDLESTLLRTIIGAMPDVSGRLDEFLDEIDQKAASATTNSGASAPDRHNLLKGYRSRAEYPKIFELKQTVKKVEAELEEHMVYCRRLLGLPDLQYRTVSQTEYLIEIPVGKVNKVPRDWDKISGTKTHSRFHSPEVRSFIAERARCHEQLDTETAVAWQQFQKQVADCYGELRSVVQRLAVLDALSSLAAVAKRGGWCRPEMVDDRELTIKQGRHPMVDQLLASGYVPNDIELDHKGQIAMIITGPNMGGKSSYIRQNALIVVMAQIGSFVPADAVRMGVFDNVYTRMGAQDFIAKGQSTFLVELQEASDVLRRATSRSLVIMDELGRGTSTHDGTAIAYASLKALVEDVKCFTLFVTHYQFICQMQDELPVQIHNHHMSFMEEGKDKIAFMYRLVRGRAQRSFGLNVALLARLPQSIVDRAHCKSKELEEKVAKRVRLHSARMVGEVCEYAKLEADENVLRKLQQAAKSARRLIRTQELS